MCWSSSDGQTGAHYFLTKIWARSPRTWVCAEWRAGGIVGQAPGIVRQVCRSQMSAVGAPWDPSQPGASHKGWREGLSLTLLAFRTEETFQWQMDSCRGGTQGRTLKAPTQDMSHTKGDTEAVCLGILVTMSKITFCFLKAVVYSSRDVAQLRVREPGLGRGTRLTPSTHTPLNLCLCARGQLESANLFSKDNTRSKYEV